METETTRLDDSTVSLKITVPWSEVDQAREQAIDDLIKQVTLPGFRKGAAPKKIAREKLAKERVDEETIKKVLPKAYIDAVKENKINPIVNPRIHVEAFAEGTDLVFIAETAEEPKIELKNYKEEVKKITAKSKIILPGKTEVEKPNLDAIVEAVLKSADVKISKMLIENEVNRLLSNVVDELKTLGMTLEQYLNSRGKTGEQLRAEYEEKATNDLKLEFALRKIAEEEKITVEQKDVDDVLSKVKDEKQKQEMLQNSYLLSAIIRQQKTLDFLSKI